MKFTVKRLSWARGKNPTTNYLFSNLTKKQCCLGFVCQQLGFSEGDLRFIGRPEDLHWNEIEDGRDILIDWSDYDTVKPGFRTHTRLTEKAITINDEETDDEQGREKRLSKLFKDNGHEMVFVD